MQLNCAYHFVHSIQVKLNMICNHIIFWVKQLILASNQRKKTLFVSLQWQTTPDMPACMQHYFSGRFFLKCVGFVVQMERIPHPHEYQQVWKNFPPLFTHCGLQHRPGHEAKAPGTRVQLHKQSKANSGKNSSNCKIIWSHSCFHLTDFNRSCSLKFKARLVLMQTWLIS